MALRPIKGRPGKFLDTNSGNVLDISDYREDDKYDTEVIPAGPVAFGTDFFFFRDIQGKQAVDTNFTQGSRLSAGEEMIIDRVGATVRNAAGRILPTPSDIKMITEDSFLRVTVNGITLSEGPLVKFPSGYGLAGNTNENGQGIVSIGVASTAAAKKLLKTQLITAQHEVLGQLTFQARLWANILLAIPDPGDRQADLSVACLVTVWLHGLLKTASSK